MIKTSCCGKKHWGKGLCKYHYQKQWSEKHVDKTRTTKRNWYRKHESKSKKFPVIEGDSRIIEYKASPTGRAFIEKLQPPFTPNKNGIGFIGTVLQTAERDLIQCFECGGWYTTLLSHLIHVHKMSSHEYKDKYSLYYNQKLCSDAYSLVMRRNGYKLSKWKDKHPDIVRFHEGRINQIRNQSLAISSRQTVQHKNSLGTCDLQLITVVWEYIHREKRLPTHHQLPKYETFKARFGDGSVIDANSRVGLPHLEFKGSRNYVFPDGSKFNVNWNTFDFIMFYDLMISKCPNLRKEPSEVLKLIK